MGADKADAKQDDLFDFTVALPAVPEAWLDKVTVQSWSAPAVGDYYGGYGYNSRTFPGGAQGKKPGGRDFPIDNLLGAGYIDEDFWDAFAKGGFTPEAWDELARTLGDDAAMYGIETPLLEPVDESAIDWPVPEDEEVFVPGFEFSKVVRDGLGLTNLTTDQYPSLRTYSVYRILLEELSSSWCPLRTGPVLEIHNIHKQGISYTPEAFIKFQPCLASYLRDLSAPSFGVDASVFASDVFDLLEDYHAGTIY